MENHSILNALRENSRFIIILIASVLCFVPLSIRFFSMATSRAEHLFWFALLGTIVGSAGTIISGITAKRKGKQNRPFFSFMIADALLILVHVFWGIYYFAVGNSFSGSIFLFYAAPILLGFDVLVSAGYLIVMRRRNGNRGK